MKKILIVIRWLEVWIGSEKAAINIWDWLYHKWHNVNYLTIYETHNKYPHKWKETCLNEKVNLNIFVKLLRLLTRSYKIKKYCKKNNIDIVISHIEDINIFSILSKILYRNTSKIIVVNHNLLDYSPNIIKKLVKLFYNYADRIITTTYENRNNFIQDYWVIPEKIKTIHNMIDIESINEKLLWEVEKWDTHLFENNRFTFVNIGRLSFQKNHELLLWAFEKLYQENNNVQLIILWQWELKEKLENQISSYRSKDNIYFLWIRNNPLPYLKMSHGFVLSSRYEWFALALIEAMQAWLPIITTDHRTGWKELLRKNCETFEQVKTISHEDYGILVPNFDEEFLKDAMLQIISDTSSQEKYQQKSLMRYKDFDKKIILGIWNDVIENI